jgi:hypothetical protein
MADLVVLQVRCAHCTGPVRLYVSAWREALHQQLEQPTEQLSVWTCPTCHETNHGRFPGRLELVEDGSDGQNDDQLQT